MMRNYPKEEDEKSLFRRLFSGWKRNLFLKRLSRLRRHFCQCREMSASKERSGISGHIPVRAHEQRKKQNRARAGTTTVDLLYAAAKAPFSYL
jgi:hypothetical protein